MIYKKHKKKGFADHLLGSDVNLSQKSFRLSWLIAAA